MDDLFVKVYDTHVGKEVYIDPTRITRVYDLGLGSEVYFADGESVEIEEGPEVLARKIKDFLEKQQAPMFEFDGELLEGED